MSNTGGSLSPIQPAGCLLLAALLLVPSARAEPPLAVPVDGKPFRATLQAADAQWRLTFASAEDTRDMPAADLVRWGACPETARGSLVVFGDGSLLAADVREADQENLTAGSALLGTLKLPRARLAGVILFAPADPNRRRQLLDQVTRAADSADRVLLANGDQLPGTVTEIAGDKIHIQTEVGPVTLERFRVVAVAFRPGPRQVPQPPAALRAWAGLADGSRLLATRLVVDGQTLTIRFGGGQEGKTPAEDLVFLQPFGGRAVYLSDLEAAGSRQIPFLDLKWPYTPDRNVLGGQLRAEGRLFLKGLGMHSAARVTYQLDRPYRRFQAELAIDEVAGPGGSVRMRVYVDGQPKSASPVIRGGRAPLAVDVDITGAKRLDLVVDYADRADVLDYANWLDARLVK